MSGRNLRSSRRLAVPIIGLLIALVGGACSTGGGGAGQTTVTVASVDNPSMADLNKLLPEFQKTHPNINVKIVTLPEDQVRQQVTQDVAAKSGRYDLFTIGRHLRGAAVGQEGVARGPGSIHREGFVLCARRPHPRSQVGPQLQE